MSEETNQTTKPTTVAGFYEPVLIDPNYGGTYRGLPRGKGGFLRQISACHLEQAGDPRVSSELSRRFGLRGGEHITGTIEKGSSRTPGLLVRVDEIFEINERPASEYLKVKPVEDQKVSEPYRQMRVETEGGPLPMRVIDLMIPIGFGQRGVLLAPPHSGKTILLQQIAHGVTANYPDVTVMTLLIDERPEDVTEIRRSVAGEVIASSGDREAEDHIRVTNLVIERAKRMVETGRDVLILVDSLTRLARAFHAVAIPRSPREPGVLDLEALGPARSVFRAARNVDEGGSLTIIGTLRVGDGNEGDALIARQLLEDANLRISLSRELVDSRVWPAIDIFESGTDRDELMLSSEAVQIARGIRDDLEGETPPKAMKKLLDRLRQHETNEDLVLALD